jgi:hypothetical protein
MRKTRGRFWRSEQSRGLKQTLNNLCISETKSAKVLSQNETKSAKTIKHEMFAWQSTSLDDNYHPQSTSISL